MISSRSTETRTLNDTCVPEGTDCFLTGNSYVSQYVWVPVVSTVDYDQYGYITTITLTATVVTVVNTILDTTTTTTEKPTSTSQTNALGTRTERITYTTDNSIVTTDL